ncbi:MAG: alginate export family protein [Bacteroidales bacterium]|jgi:hypothetical protein|nr:alginate export family protein [Bacteroidales bacterium]
MKKIIVSICSLILGVSHYSTAQFIVDAHLRPRSEVRHGYKALPDRNDKTACFISQRSRLSLALDREKYQMGFSIQDVRVWGDEELYSSTGIKGNNSSLDLFQAWLWLKLGSNCFLQIGRQQWSYDDQRLLSERNWGQHGLAYDGVLFGYKTSGFQLDLGLSLNNDDENLFGNEYTPDKMKFLDFIYLKHKFTGKSYLSFLGVLSGYQKEENSETVYVTATFGPYLTIEKNNLLYKGNFFYQLGTNPAGENVNACMFSFDIDTKIISSFYAGGGLDWLSGENECKGDNSFDILYGARHRFYGEMDYFSNLYQSTMDLGLRDLYAKCRYQISPKHSVTLFYHFFSLQNEVELPGTSGLTKNLGDEIDLTYRYKALIPLDLRIGFSMFFPTETMKYLQHVDGGELSYFSYIQLTFTPELFNGKI